MGGCGEGERVKMVGQLFSCTISVICTSPLSHGVV